jgi:hypothetical protein
MNGTQIAILLLTVWLIGNLHGAYRYEKLWLDRSLMDIWRDLRREA